MRKAKHQEGIEENGGPVCGAWLLPPVGFKNKCQDHHYQGGHGGHPKRQGEGWQWNGGSAHHLGAQSPSAGRDQGQQHTHRFAREIGQLMPKQQQNPQGCCKHPTPCALGELVLKNEGANQG